MADSGRIQGQCKHSADREHCVTCLRAEVERLKAELYPCPAYPGKTRQELAEAFVLQRQDGKWTYMGNEISPSLSLREK
jgi:hypothetical protein